MTTGPARPGDGWRVFHATGQAPDNMPSPLPKAPPWRQFQGGPPLPHPNQWDAGSARRLGASNRLAQLGDAEIDVVNAAILLRRPLLVTGPPGIGKSTLAYLIARELGLGRVLQWSIVSRSTLRSGLYDYDAIGRAQTVAELATRTNTADAATSTGRAEHDAPPRPTVGEFLTLGPLGTALLPYRSPRILLVDELDKGDIDLPNDLLHVLENGAFDIPELVRTGEDHVEVHTDDPQGRTVVQRGRVECAEFPIVVMTSNGEREFPAAFRRRCLPLEMRPPSRELLLAIVEGHLRHRPDGLEDLVEDFAQRLGNGGTHSVDQLLNAAQLITQKGFPAGSRGRSLIETLLRDLSKGP
ncbi:AAA family ATPase [Streptomyces aureus]|uniref:AAA family ATPase n=1 Tax=Streptomyces aureus TaxID=193461 RepID=UPI00055E1842|nr:MoxR family ATPase [Streptomyces aureus]